MNALTLGIIIFVGFTAALSSMMILSLQRARAEGLKGSHLFSRLMPYLIIDAAFLIIFVIWLLGQL